MSAYLDTLIDALRTVIAATWPEVVENGVWEADQVVEVPYEQLTPPYAVVVMDESDPSEWATNALSYEVPAHIYYIAAVQGPLSPLRAKLEALRDALHPRLGALSAGQVLRLSSPSTSRELDMNAVMVEKGMAHRAGRVTATVLVGQVP